MEESRRLCFKPFTSRKCRCMFSLLQDDAQSLPWNWNKHLPWNPIFGLSFYEQRGLGKPNCFIELLIQWYRKHLFRTGNRFSGKYLRKQLQMKILTARNTHEFLNVTQPVWVYRALPKSKAVYELPNTSSYKGWTCHKGTLAFTVPFGLY